MNHDVRTGWPHGGLVRTAISGATAKPRANKTVSIKRGHDGGMPEFEPTAEQREIVSRVPLATHCLGWSAMLPIGGRKQLDHC